MIFVEGLRLVPTAFLMLVPLLRSMDPALEEAAAASGASPTATMRKITMVLLAPGILGVVIFQAMTALEVFEIAGVLGLPAGIYVFSTKIYTILNTTLDVPAYGEANALAILYVAIAFVATYFYMKVISKSERYAIVSGKGYSPRLQRLGAAKYPAQVLVFLFFFLSTVLPFLVLLYVSLIKFLQVPSAAAFAAMSLDHYRTVFHTPRISTVLWNTLYLVIVSATVTTVASFLISMVVVRSRFWGRKILDQLAFLPHAIPGLVLGLAMLWVFLKADRMGLALFGTVWSIAIAFAVSFISYGTRAMNAAIIQIHRDLEEAASVSGAPMWRIMWRVFLPLMLPSFIGVWVWTMLHVVRIAGLPLVLFDGADNQVLAVFIWMAWDQGNIGIVGAIGTMLMAALFIVTLGFRFFGFGRGAALR
jgi:iron(III) transport system permease protein